MRSSVPNLSPRLGGALSAVGKHSDAVDAFLKAYALLPEDQAVKTALEVCQSNEGSSREATALKFRSRVRARRCAQHIGMSFPLIADGSEIPQTCRPQKRLLGRFALEGTSTHGGLQM